MGPIGHSVAGITALLGAPVLALAWLSRPAWRGNLAERLGAFPSGGARSPVWIHGASVGETLAIGALVDAFVSRGVDVVTSTTTPTGRAVARASRSGVPSGLAPLDHPWLVARALDAVEPSVLVLVETELWPSWIRAAHERAIPVVMVSARISDRSLPRYRRAAPLLRGTLGRIHAVGARTREDAARFVALGLDPERVEVTGDLKLEPREHAAPLPSDLSDLLGEHDLWVAASTHEGEEAAALECLAALERAGHPVVGVVAPRHPDRFDRAAAILEASGRRVQRRSRTPAAPLAPGEILLLDTLGELARLWPRATVAFVGGTLTPIGGHNLLEPVQAGCAVLFGPHTANTREAAALLLATGAGVRVGDAAELARASVTAFADPAAWSERGAAGRRALDAHRGASERALALVERVRSGAHA